MPHGTFNFNPITKQLMDLIINHYYTDKEVFLRELIFNASDALDKVRFKSTTDYPIEKEPNFHIRIIPDKTRKILTILDTGIGMTKQEMIQKLGTYVKPGAQAFIEALKSGADISKMGHFGVGFYSAFLVADKVTVISKSDDKDRQYKWESVGGDTYTVTNDEQDSDQLTRGTKVVLHMKNNSLEFLEEKRLKEVINKHSEFVQYPIELQIWEQLNREKPTWTRRPETITKKEYCTLYKSLTHDWEDFLAVKHIVSEGKLEFTAVLFIPRVAPFNLFGSKKSIRLYVRRVFMTDDCEELIPEYLSFIRGVVDSEDLPSNVPVEILKQNNILQLIKSTIVKKVLELIEELSEDPERYKRFYEQFSKDIKLGVLEDPENRAKLCEFLRFYTSKPGDEQISLKEYVSRMKEGQKHIYYVTGKSRDDAASSPALARVQNKGYEVIYMVDPADECVIQQVSEYCGKKLKDCASKDVGFEARKDEANRNLTQNQEKSAGEPNMQETTAV